jgi:hypothetical protein
MAFITMCAVARLLIPGVIHQGRTATLAVRPTPRSGPHVASARSYAYPAEPKDCSFGNNRGRNDDRVVKAVPCLRDEFRFCVDARQIKEMHEVIVQPPDLGGAAVMKNTAAFLDMPFHFAAIRLTI